MPMTSKEKQEKAESLNNKADTVKNMNVTGFQ